MYYSYNYEDLEKCNRQPYEYYTLEQLKENVQLTAHKKPFYPEGGWCIYNSATSMSGQPFDCTSKEEAYALLLEAENNSLYEYWHDL